VGKIIISSQQLVNRFKEQNKHKSEYMHHRISRYVNVMLDFSYPQVIHRFETILVDNTLFAVFVVMVYLVGRSGGLWGRC
jgi:hypothetical protein